MNKTRGLLALAIAHLLALPLAAQAQEAAPRTRAEVRAEAASAVKSGTVVKGEGSQASPPMKSTKTRAQVRREAAAAERDGRIIQGEGPPRAASAPSNRTRAEVRREAAAAVKAGTVGKGPDVKK